MLLNHLLVAISHWRRDLAGIGYNNIIMEGIQSLNTINFFIQHLGHNNEKIYQDADHCTKVATSTDCEGW